MPRVWLDVGANRGGHPLEVATRDQSVHVFAFEPDVSLAALSARRAPNYVILAAAIAEFDGVAQFHLTDDDTGNSLLPIQHDNAERWRGGTLTVLATVPVPAMRIDTFMDTVRIETVEWLFVDAQGADLSVLKSAGRRLADIENIRVEVAVTPYPVYRGSASKDEILGYLASFGFALTGTEPASDGQEEYLTFARRDLPASS
jgi:FkbM family methyltransferase